ncbi:HAD hydrolase-like protein [Ectobacillus ponti]|uniref:HAD hydrolase-like protein n=1 Tax=Ectobacillus ponti TaxID=2961894 RepID=A0AA41X5K1_9BACI|nr:HAD hydrolase-like protein [Ectobacillus ponti]MCP8967593.1 HAD hydrolase-like protein [Ectobacillus ponti]
MLQYVLFDFDGTLADSKHAFIAAWNELAEQRGYQKIEMGRLEELRKLSMQERSRQMDFPLHKLPLVIPQLYRLYRRHAKDVELFAGMPELLGELKAHGCGVAVLSSNAPENIRGLLQKHGVDIPLILTSSLVFGKDRLLKRFLKEHGLRASEVLYVGDEQRDIAACKKAGVQIAWVSWGYDAHEAVEASKPDYIAHEPADLLQICRNL